MAEPGGYWGAVLAAGKKLGGQRAYRERSLLPVYDQALKAGVEDPSMGGSYQIPPDMMPELRAIGVRDGITVPMDHNPWLQRRMEFRFPNAATRQQQYDEMVSLANVDPHTYISVTTPRRHLERVYGDATDEVINNMLLSQRRGGRALAGHPILQALLPDATARALDEPVSVLRGPGVAFQSQDSPRGSALGFYNQRHHFVQWPRALDQSSTPRHELSHSYMHGQAKPDDLPLLSTQSRNWKEAQVYAALAKQNHFLKTGDIISNQQDGKRFLENLLDEPAPPKGTPDPARQFGPGNRIGQPIHGYQDVNDAWRRALRNATDEDKARLIELLPKVADTSKPMPVS